MLFARIIFLALVVICPGCIPYHLRESPHVTGTVVDEASRQPIDGATLYYQTYPKHRIQTSKDGRFDFPPIYKWALVPLGPFDRFGSQLFIVGATNYNPMCCHYCWWEDLTNQVFFLRHQ